MTDHNASTTLTAARLAATLVNEGRTAEEDGRHPAAADLYAAALDTADTITELPVTTPTEAAAVAMHALAQLRGLDGMEIHNKEGRALLAASLARADAGIAAVMRFLARQAGVDLSELGCGYFIGDGWQGIAAA
jgi:hypothetical protein